MLPPKIESVFHVRWPEVTPSYLTSRKEWIPRFVTLISLHRRIQETIAEICTQQKITSKYEFFIVLIPNTKSPDSPELQILSLLKEDLNDFMLTSATIVESNVANLKREAKAIRSFKIKKKMPYNVEWTVKIYRAQDIQCERCFKKVIPPQRQQSETICPACQGYMSQFNEIESSGGRSVKKAKLPPNKITAES